MKRTILSLFILASAGVFSILPAVAEPRVEVAFSPREGALELVLKAIGSARSSLRLAGYSFTSPDVVAALIEAKRRGVEVKVVVDYRDNRSAKSLAALNLLVNNRIPTRTISVYPIFHEKFIVVDGETVETGSFNFSAAASFRNSENVLVVWGDTALAATYLAHFENRFAEGEDYLSAY
jgi:phosphatidylserine/phosphatidylglycerophosphate/cardiolipin synthase-like enzyme